MHSQEYGNDEANSSDPLAVVAIIPEKIPHDGKEQIVIVFNHRIHVKGRGQFFVDFVGTAGAVQVPAKQLNSSTLILETPAYSEASVVTAYVYHGIHRRLLGQHRFEFLSRNDTFYRLLYGALDPVRFMCESLQISPPEVQDLDTALAETFKANAPEGFNLLGIHKHVAGESSAEHPTLLHFASEFGLSKLISNLMLYPGAQEACKIRNYHGQRPDNIAENHGFHDLANSLCTFLDQGDPDQIYTDMEHAGDEEYYVKMQKDDGSYYYVPMNGEGHELYVDMDGKRYINLDKHEEGEECYMKKQNEDGSYHYVPMKGKAGRGGKMYDDVTEKKPYHKLQDHTESDQYTSEDLYENYQAGSASNDQEFYVEMERNPEGQDNPEEVYMDMEPEKGDPSELYMDMEKGKMSDEYAGYVKPKSNLPVNPDPAFYRSASSAAAIRAKEIENERKTRSLPPSKGPKSHLDIQSIFQQSVAEGNLTEEEVAELLKKMRISETTTAPTVQKRGSTSSSPTPRRGSTSSRSSTSTTSSSGSSGSSGISSAHEFTQHSEPNEFTEEEEEIHGTLADLFPTLKQKGKIHNDGFQAQVEQDAPPPVPQPDYHDKQEKTPGSPGARKHHSRSKTVPVKQEDVQAGLLKTPTPRPPVARRRSEPQGIGSGLDTQSKVSLKKNPPQPSERPPAPIPESELQRPPKSPPPPVSRRPMPTPSPDSSRHSAPVRPPPSLGIPVFPEGPPPAAPQRVPRPAPRGTSK